MMKFRVWFDYNAVEQRFERWEGIRDKSFKAAFRYCQKEFLPAIKREEGFSSSVFVLAVDRQEKGVIA